MLIVKKSNISGVIHKMEIDITEEKYWQFQQGSLGLIQDVFPHLTKGEREFLISGIHPIEWEQLFGNMNNE